MATHIEWTDETWNPGSGCTRISEGCQNCYIERTPPMRMAHRRFDGPQIGATTGVRLHPDRLAVPLRWRKPRKVFVCSMADLFHEDVPAAFIADVFGVMAANYMHSGATHTFQVLTKRPARMRALLSDATFRGEVAASAAQRTDEGHADTVLDAITTEVWPLPNVWLGVSTESQKWADIRIPQLLDTPAAVRFVSAEPLLGPVALHPYWMVGAPYWGEPEPTGPNGIPMRPLMKTRGLDWVIVGGESGPGARPMHPDWARSLRDQCVLAKVPFLFKQWGEHVTVDQMPEDTFRGWDSEHGTSQYGRDVQWRVGKKAAGRELDERTWDEYPTSHIGGKA